MNGPEQNEYHLVIRRGPKPEDDEKTLLGAQFMGDEMGMAALTQALFLFLQRSFADENSRITDTNGDPL